MPEDVQLAMLRTVKGLENVEMLRCGTHLGRPFKEWILIAK